MKIFVTGGAGFIGSHLCRRLLDVGHSVKAYDNLVLGKKELLTPCLGSNSFEFVEADLLDMQRLQSEMNGFDLVIHLAANSDISQGAARTDVDLNNGTIATYHVLEAMRVLSVKQIIFASTSAIYGEAEIKPTPENYGPLLPISFYGASKLACEGMASAFSHNCDISTWVYRFANIVGPHSTHGAIHDFITRLLKQPERLQVLGNGTQRKSYLYVQDCIDGMVFGYHNTRSSITGHPFQVFNLASEGVTTVRFIAEEVVRQMAPVTGVEAKLEFGEEDRGWVGDVPYTHLNGAQLATHGWQPKYSSNEAVQLAVSQIIAERTSDLRANKS